MLTEEGIEIKGLKTTLNLSGALKRYRDDEWETEINSFQIVELHYPKTKGARIKAYALNGDNLMVNIGSIELYPENTKYPKAILGELKEDTITLANGDQRTRLKGNQEIYLLSNADAIDELIGNPKSKVRFQARTTTSIIEMFPTLYGCGLLALLLALAYAIIWLFGC